MYGKGKKLNQPKIQKQYKENIIISIRNFFILKKKKIEKLKIEKQNRTIRGIKTFFSQEIIIINRKE